jgi:hypothetical protein
MYIQKIFIYIKTPNIHLFVLFFNLHIADETSKYKKLLVIGTHSPVNYLGTFAKLRKAAVRLVMSVCQSAGNNSAPTGRIFNKFDKWGFVNLSIKFECHEPVKAYWLRDAPKGLIFKNFTLCHTVFAWFLFISEQIATFTLYNATWFVFINEMKSVYCAVRNVSLNKAVFALSFKG